jgi:hypothetical protein
MPSASIPIKVAIVEDHQKIRKGLMALIDGREGFRAAGSFRSMEEALAGIGPLWWDRRFRLSSERSSPGAVSSWAGLRPASAGQDFILPKYPYLGDSRCIEV